MCFEMDSYQCLKGELLLVFIPVVFGLWNASEKATGPPLTPRRFCFCFECSLVGYFLEFKSVSSSEESVGEEKRLFCSHEKKVTNQENERASSGFHIG